MTMPAGPSYYICGSNMHGQIKDVLKTSGSTENQLYSTKPVQMTVSRKNTKFYMTWSQLWICEGQKLTCFGFNSNKLLECLNEIQDHINNVVPLRICTLLDTTSGIHLISEKGSRHEISDWKSGTNISLFTGTDDKVIGLKDTGHLYEATIDIVDDKPSVEFATFDSQFSKMVKSVACGHEHILVLSTEGEVFSYGSSSRGQLGHGTVSVDEIKAPKVISTLEGIHITSIAAGGWHSLAISDDGDLYVWGWNEKGQLGLHCPNLDKSDRKAYSSQVKTEIMGGESTLNLAEESSKQQDIPLQVHQAVDPCSIQTVPFGLDIPDDVHVVKAVCGSRHTCVLLDSGIVMNCGWNGYGQLGHGTTYDCDYLQTVCYFIDKSLKIQDIYAGAWNTVFVTESEIT